MIEQVKERRAGLDVFRVSLSKCFMVVEVRAFGGDIFLTIKQETTGDGDCMLTLYRYVTSTILPRYK